MFSAIVAILISLSVGGALYWYTQHNSSAFQVSKKELLIGSIASTLLLLICAPLTEHLILDNKTKYYEYWNGYETAAIEDVTSCERDGLCNETYSCDPYTTTEIYFDEDGDMHTRTVTKYHSCPYLKQEYQYRIVTTLGDTRIPGVYAKDRTPWRSGEGVPNSIPNGPPEFWKQAHDRIAAGKNGGATEVHSYKNFLLASDKTILDTYSYDIDRYKEAGLLLDHTRNYKDPIYSYYLADKFQAVKLDGVDLGKWNEYLNRLNGYLGKELQGDIHIVAINADAVKDRDTYPQALFAYWKSDAFGKNALSKNAVGIVIGVRDGVVEWSRATGGLPIGNEGLLADLRDNLSGTKFDPDALIGIPKKEEGIITRTFYGEHKYERPCMECIEEQQDGYNYLKSDVYVSGWQKFWIVFVSVLLSTGMWVGFLYYDEKYGSFR